jgi:1-aminocyclopropane-1-carboxylate deaminase
MNFVHTFHDQTGILVDPIYNLKVFRGCLELAKRGVFEPGSRIVVLHTGGIQGWQGMMYLYPEIQPPA